MYQFIETVKIDKGNILHSDKHNERMNRTRREFFGSKDFLFIEDFIDPADVSAQDVFRCTILYDEKIRNCNYLLYHKREIKSLGLVFDDNIDYSWKYADRSHLNQLKKSRPDCDDIIIVKNGRITDSSFSNLVFYDGSNYLTPSKPLFNGIKRSILLEKTLIREAGITPADLPSFSHAGLINAMLDLEDYKIEIILK